VGKPVLIIASHSIEEWSQVDLLSSLGYDVFSLGSYIDPAHPHDPKRPALSKAPRHPELQAVVDSLGTLDNIGAAAAYIPDVILEWLGDDGVIICHHYIAQRIYPQWPRLADWMGGSSGRRVVRRTVGQSVANDEHECAPFRAAGLEIVRYSPDERYIPGYAGEDALIRFHVDPARYAKWDGSSGWVGNVTQHLWRRSGWCNAQWATEAVDGLDAMFAGPGSEDGPVPGMGELTWNEMRDYLRRIRAYVYTGTQPASYTLGLIEAMMTGVPIVSIGRSRMDLFPYGPALFEAADLAWRSYDDPADAREELRHLINDPRYAAEVSLVMRTRALDHFRPEQVGAQWKAFLG
jgi:glycosyltransferase involved in cell wall biosynthesis